MFFLTPNSGRFSFCENALSHNDFAITPEGEIDPQKTSNYISFLKENYRYINDFIESCEGINTLQYTEFAQIFYSEFQLEKREKSRKPAPFKESFVQLTSREGVFILFFKNLEAALHAEKVKLSLNARNFPWQCEVFLYNRKSPDILSTLEIKVRQMLREECNDEKEIEYQHFRNQIKLIFKEIREKFSISNQHIRLVTNVTKGALSGRLSILEWCSLKFSRRERERRRWHEYNLSQDHKFGK